MNNDIKIEYYLLQLDRELKPLPVSERAEIITEIKSHIREASEKDPSRPIDRILQEDFGLPKVVAGRYLSAKGLKPSSGGERGKKVFKWLAVGTVAFFAFIFFAGMMAVWYFSPLIKVDNEKGRVVLLGGLIDVNEQIGQVKVGDLVVNDALKESVEIHGDEDVWEKGIRLIKIPFNTAKLDVSHTEKRRLVWDCKVSADAESPQVDVSAGVLTLNLDRLNLAKCAIRIPIGMRTEIQGVNGSMEVEYPRESLDISLNNGRVKILPDPRQVYDFDVKVKNGLQDFFPRSNDKGAVKVKVSVVNGMVKKE